jgi:hypothetical protein
VTIFITADQVYLHAIGDYLTQSDWMANGKTKAHIPAAAHALVYSLPFLIFTPSLIAWLTILITHFFIDRYRLARYVVWVKNFLAPVGNNLPWSKCKDSFGYQPDRPAWMACWLMIIADNCLHIGLNAAALNWL